MAVAAKTFALIGAGPHTGLSTARLFGKDGFRVAMVARRRESLDEMARSLEAEGIEARGYVADLRHAEALERALAELREELGPVGVLFVTPFEMQPETRPDRVDLRAGARTPPAGLRAHAGVGAGGCLAGRHPADARGLGRADRDRPRRGGRVDAGSAQTAGRLHFSHPAGNGGSKSLSTSRIIEIWQAGLSSAAPCMCTTPAGRSTNSPAWTI